MPWSALSSKGVGQGDEIGSTATAAAATAVAEAAAAADAAAAAAAAEEEGFISFSEDDEVDGVAVPAVDHAIGTESQVVATMSHTAWRIVE